MKIGFRCSEGGQRFQDALEQTIRAEDRGFDSVWVAEHHGWDAIWPSSHLALAGLATRTETIELGTSITLLPQANPVRLAGEANLLDVVSEGRFTLGVGTGWRADEMRNLGYDFESRGPRMTDHLRAMNALWDAEVASYDGEFVSFEEFELTPEPIQNPHPPVFVGGEVDASLKRAAYLGDAWFPVWLSGIESLREDYETYRGYVREAGEDPGERSNPILRIVAIDEDADRARERLQELFDGLVAKYRDRGAEIPEAMQEGIRKDVESFADGRFVYGTPEECVADLERLEAELGVDHVVFKLYNPGTSHEEMCRWIDLIGDGVIPEVGN